MSALCHFCRYYLETNKASKSEGARKVGQVHHFCKFADATCQKLSKLVHVVETTACHFSCFDAFGWVTGRASGL